MTDWHRIPAGQIRLAYDQPALLVHHLIGPAPDLGPFPVTLRAIGTRLTPEAA